MALNQAKAYPQLLEIIHLTERERKESLRKVFDRDITFNDAFLFQAKQIRPTQADGEIDLGNVFNHLITEDEIVEREDGSTYKRRVFEKDRSERLHWIKPHVDEEIKDTVHVFSVIERDQRKRKDITRTYIYNSDQKYVVVLEPQNSELDYFLLSAYHLNKKYAIKQMKKKMKKKLPQVL